MLGVSASRTVRHFGRTETRTTDRPVSQYRCDAVDSPFQVEAGVVYSEMGLDVRLG